jgi:hypothetical protein
MRGESEMGGLLLDSITGIPKVESVVSSPEEQCASLYDAIRDMSAYGSVVEAEKRRNDGGGRRFDERETVG